MNKALPYLWYPAMLVAAVAAYGLLLRTGTTPVIAAYVPVSLTALTILALERILPANPGWRASQAEIQADAAFMAIVQVALPRSLGVFSLLAIAHWMHDHAPSTAWPHFWPLALQVLLMVLVVDLLRYALHRACHRYPLLWRLHEVHHSPEILYALNVGRFHPIEKALHFALDTMPFLLLGVAPEVIAGYFLLYSVNGLFQHSNLRLRYGWLNYVVGSAETHRWHHARDPRIASCNFSNTTIVWDLVFGTWYLPEKENVTDIGVEDRAFPKGFLAQMGAPFRHMGVVPFENWWADRWLKMQLATIGLRERIRLGRATRDPMRSQYAVLARILAENRDTTFGRLHGFTRMASLDDFTKRVPVNDYEALRPFIEAEIDTGEAALTREAPLCYVRTSGTTGKPKDLPLTTEHLRSLRGIHRSSLAFQYRTCPDAFSGAILAIVSPGHEGFLINGKSFGSASGIVAGCTQRRVADKFVIPAPVFTLQDARVKYLLILRLALGRPEISCIGTANPTTLLILGKMYREHHAELLTDLHAGTFFLAKELPFDVAASVEPRLKPCPGRAEELTRLHALNGNLRLADLWPAVRMIVTWTCASAGVALRSLRNELPPATRILELGYISSEFRGTITIGRRAGSGLPTLETHFFEFAERRQWDRGERSLITLDQLKKGVDYYVVVTTPSGLYRYFINDLVRVSGFLHATPLLKFLQKGKGVTNITGEKLYESQVLTAVGKTIAEIGRTPCFIMMLASEETRTYDLFVETDAGLRPAAGDIAARVDTALARLNVEYEAKRKSRRLECVEVHWLRAGTGDAYRRYCVGQGQREGQFKPVSLAYRREFTFDLDANTENP